MEGEGMAFLSSIADRILIERKKKKIESDFLLTCIACILFADWLRGALTFGLDYLHRAFALPNCNIASQHKVAHSKNILCQ
jgi:hypothetical protein